MWMVAPSLTKTLYRELLRSGRRIEALTRPANTARVSARLQGFGDPYAIPTERARRAFRMNRTSPTAADDAFAALRCASETLAWLQPNTLLHGLAEQGAPTEEGALVIASLLRGSGGSGGSGGGGAVHDEASERAAVSAELDRLAGEAQLLIDAAPAPLTRLHRLALINTALFRDAGFSGEFDPIALNSSLPEVLQRRRGIPILLCILYQAVAARLGIPLAFTNFPQRILLRCDPRAAAPPPPLAAPLAAAQVEAGGRVRDGVAAGALCGLWVADFGPHGPEVVETRVLDRGEGLTLTATKLTGDPHVPAGEMSWEVRLSPRRQETRFVRRPPRPTRFAVAPREEAAEVIPLGTALPALVQVAEAGFIEPRLVSATLEARLATAAAHADGGGSGGQGAGSAGGEAEAEAEAEAAAETEAKVDGSGEGLGGATGKVAVEGEGRAAGELTLTLTIDGAAGAAGAPLVFSRADETALWFVDPWARGALLPPSACEAALTHVGVPLAEQAGGTDAIPPTRVWARMLRNLQVTHEHELRTTTFVYLTQTRPLGICTRVLSNQVREPRGSAEARFWEDAGVGLDGPEEQEGLKQ